MTQPDASREEPAELGDESVTFSDPEKHSLSEDLQAVLASGGDEGLTVARLVDQLQDRGFGLLLILLSLPSALPVPAPGYSTPFGIALALLAIQLLVGRRTPWLPERARKTRIGRRVADAMIGASARFFRFVERMHLVKPRFSWVTGSVGERFAAVLVLVMAGLMILPIPGTNTGPAMVIFLVGIALTEKDGLLMFVALLGGALAVALYAVVVYLFYQGGAMAIEQLKESIKEWVTGAETPPADHHSG